MSDYKQMQLDLRLDYERDLKTNISQVAKFTGLKMREDMETTGRPLQTVQSKQEAYGIFSQQFVSVMGKQKLMKGSMNDFLKCLAGDTDASHIAGNIYNSAIELAQESCVMAAQATRILEDLYYGQSTPIEDMISQDDAYADFDDINEEEEEED